MASAVPPPLRGAQRQAMAAVEQLIDDPDEVDGIIKMFCGTGKSRVMLEVIKRVLRTPTADGNFGGASTSRAAAITTSRKVALVVCPTIALITQFMTDYVLKYGLHQHVSVMSVCSVRELTEDDGDGAQGIQYTTQPAKISEFFSSHADDTSRCLVLVTYQSLETLLSVIYEQHVVANVCLLDEAHHITGDKASSLVIDNDEFQDHVLKCVYFTATPRNVWKGVQMLPDKDGNPGQCGRILFNYPLIHAVRDSVCRNFEVLIMLHEQQIDSAGSSNPAAAASDNSQQQKSNRQHTEAPDTRRYRKRSGDDNADDNADDDDVSNDADEPNLAISSSSSRSVLMADDEDFESDIEGYAMIELGMDDDDQAEAASVLEDQVDELADELIDYTEKLRVLAQAIARTGASRILTFHSGSHKGNDAVGRFATEDNRQLLQQYLSEAGGQHSSSTVRITSLTHDSKGRRAILNSFDSTPDDEVHVLASCRTIGEGVDTKNADMVMFVTPRGSYTSVVQTTGRCTRRCLHHVADAKGIIVLPCYVDLSKYQQCSTPEERHQVMMENIRSGQSGDFSSVVNYLMALGAESPEVIDELIAQALGQSLTAAGSASETKQPQQQKQINKAKKTQGPTQHAANAQAPSLHPVHGSGSECAAALEVEDAPDSDVQSDHPDDEGAAAEDVPMPHHEGPEQQPKDPAQQHVQFDASLAPRFRQLFQLDGMSVSAAGAAVGTAFLRAMLVHKPESRWMLKYELLKQFVSQRDRLPIQSESFGGEEIGEWCRAQRKSYANGWLSKQHIEDLEKVKGWAWKLVDPEQFTKNLELLRVFTSQEHRMPRNLELYKGIRLGQWCVVMRRKKKLGVLAQQQVEALESVEHWKWDVQNLVWDDNLQLLKQFVQEQGRLPKQHELYAGVKLGNWCGNERMRKRRGWISNEQQQALEDVAHWTWTKAPQKRTAAQKQKMLHLLKAYMEEKGRTPVAKEVYQGEQLGNWVDERRRQRKRGKLNPELEQELEQLPGWTWEKFTEGFRANLRALQAYVASKQRIPGQKDTFQFEGKELKLGAWCSRMRGKYSKGRLSNQDKLALEAVPGWSWPERKPIKQLLHIDGQDPPAIDKFQPGEKYDLIFSNHLELLKQFVAERRTLPSQKDTYKGSNLGAWASNQRANYKNKKLSADRVTKLEEIPGWKWTAKADLFSGKLELLHQFVAEHKRLPKNSESYKTEQLGSWCSTQRGRFNQGKLPEQHKRQLEGVQGWKWKVLSGPASMRAQSFPAAAAATTAAAAATAGCGEQQSESDPDAQFDDDHVGGDDDENIISREATPPPAKKGKFIQAISLISSEEDSADDMIDERE